MAKLEDFGFKPVDRAEALVKAADVGSALTASNAAPSPDAAPAPAATRAIGLLKLKPVRNGEKFVHFRGNREWEEHHSTKVGHSTKKLSFGSGFLLTTKHIDDLESFGPRVCRSLVHFEFTYGDVSYNSKDMNKATVTNEDVIRLARMCPNLRFVQLQGAESLSDDAVQALFQFCPGLSHLEITGKSRSDSVKLDGTCLAMLGENSNWAPKLKTLRLADQSNKKDFMKAMRALSKKRIKLLIQLVHTSESKKWGDWELEVSHQAYRKGRIWNGR